MARTKKAKKPKTPKVLVTVREHTRKFSAAKLPPRENDGTFRPKNAQRDLFGTRRR